MSLARPTLQPSQELTFVTFGLAGVSSARRPVFSLEDTCSRGAVRYLDRAVSLW